MERRTAFQRQPRRAAATSINIVGYLIISVILEHLWSDVRYWREAHYCVRSFSALGGEWSRLPARW
jgi:hypothetical protein